MTMHFLDRWPLRVAPLAMLLLSATALSALPAQAPGVQQAASIRGTVRTASGIPVGGANVFVLETLEGTLTLADGRFTIPTSAAGAITLVVKRIGFMNAQRVVAPVERDSVAIVLQPGTVSLAPVAVQAGSYTAGEERGATITPLEVVTTPGAAADINRTIQSLPGVQSVDEGTGLFVRGGNYTETRIFLNDALLLSPVQFLSPSGTFVGTVDPFLLDGIFFSSGGFGARYGDALSAVAGLRTRSRAAHPTATLGAGLATVSIDGAIPAGRGVTLRAAGNRFNLQPVLDLNGSPREYDPAPRGTDASGSAIWNYRPGAELKLFATSQSNSLGVGVVDPAFSGSYDLRMRSRLAVATWRDVIGHVSPTVSVSDSRLDRGEGFGAFQLSSDLHHRQVFAQVDWQATSALVVKAGSEIESLASGIAGSIPATESDPRPGARTTVLDSDRLGRRVGSFLEVDWRLGDRWRVIPGLRTDRSNLTGRGTLDPRLSVAWRANAFTTFTAAWGAYHQVPDPLFFDDSIGAPRLPSMRATQAIAGVHVGEDAMMLRIEAYAKRYRDLAQQTRDYLVVGGGSGSARGVDVFAKGPLFLGIQSRVAVSLVQARRTDPDARTVARAPFDISRSQTWILERALPAGMRIGTAYRVATGRPYTPVVSAQFDSMSHVFVPHYGAPMSERVPTFRRVDLSLSQYREVRSGWNSVLYLSVSNLLDRENLFEYRYSSDYSQRIPVRSVFNRAVYFGASLIHQ